VVNLILNACQALPDADRGLWITTRYNRTTASAILVVRDEGVGIDPENLSRLTDPFFTTKRRAAEPVSASPCRTASSRNMTVGLILNRPPGTGHNRDPGVSCYGQGGNMNPQSIYPSFGILLVDDEPAWLKSSPLPCAAAPDSPTSALARRAARSWDFWPGETSVW